MKFSIAVSVPLSLASMVHGAAVEMNARNLTALAAPFAVNIGADTCTSAVIIGPVGANFCGRPFVLNGISLTAEGCGGPFGLVKTGQSAVFAACTDFNETDECGIHTEWHCV
ncbi:hypothetical protein B0H14DRAFT_2826610 [Mycena olivaceomarginata]|nr:hypothetical protein B0H14DRAFT_2826610 [Mycena olivaceomarginata]